MQPKRKSQRKHDYDYSRLGCYGVTICTQNPSCLFGEIVEGDMLLNDAGRMIDGPWHENSGWTNLCCDHSLYQEPRNL